MRKCNQSWEGVECKNEGVIAITVYFAPRRIEDTAIFCISCAALFISTHLPTAHKIESVAIDEEE